MSVSYVGIEWSIGITDVIVVNYYLKHSNANIK
jgi:hypothetical protein